MRSGRSPCDGDAEAWEEGKAGGLLQPLPLEKAVGTVDEASETRLKLTGPSCWGQSVERGQGTPETSPSLRVKQWEWEQEGQAESRLQAPAGCW